MIIKVQTVKTHDGKGTFALVDVASSGGSWRSVGVSRTYWTASQMMRARSHGRTIARRYYRANKLDVGATLTIQDE